MTVLTEDTSLQLQVAGLRQEVARLAGLLAAQPCAACGHTVRGHDRSTTVVAEMARSGEYWTVRLDAVGVQLRDAKGMRHLAELVAHPGQERHVLDLVARVEGTGADLRSLGDAGPLLDAEAKTAYRRRYERLRDEIDESEQAGDQDRAARAQAELGWLAGELGRAVGLRGSDRRAASATERARVNVTRALRSAVARIGDALPVLGQHLDRSVRTGTYCIYQPHADLTLRWQRLVDVAS
jgi:hypothetical protein